MLSLEQTSLDRFEYDEKADALVIHVRPYKSELGRCSVCGGKAPGYDEGVGRRRWRARDLGAMKVFVEGNAPRVECPKHGVVRAQVPWARSGSRFTRAFEDRVAWLAARTDKSTVSELMRTTWRSVGRIVERVSHEREDDARFGRIRRLLIDEVSFRKGHRYLTVVFDGDTGQLLWASEGRDSETVHRFFDLLTDQERAGIESVAADSAPWIVGPVRERCPDATICADPFHVVSWANEAIDATRRKLWNDARRRGQGNRAREIKGTRYALLKGGERLSERHRQLETFNRPLYRAYLLKEELRAIFAAPTPAEGRERLGAWIEQAEASEVQEMAVVAARVRRHRAEIEASIELGQSNAKAEAANTKIRLIIRRAFGFHSAQAVIALAMLTLGGLCPPLAFA
jgi:transposase